MANNYGDTVTALALPTGSTNHPVRTLPEEKGSVLYTTDDGTTTEANYVSGHWVVPADLKSNVVLSAQTQETVVIKTKTAELKDSVTAKLTEKNGSTVDTAIDLSGLNSGKGVASETSSSDRTTRYLIQAIRTPARLT